MLLFFLSAAATGVPATPEPPAQPAPPAPPAPSTTAAATATTDNDYNEEEEEENYKKEEFDEEEYIYKEPNPYIDNPNIVATSKEADDLEPEDEDDVKFERSPEKDINELTAQLRTLQMSAV